MKPFSAELIRLDRLVLCLQTCSFHSIQYVNTLYETIFGFTMLTSSPSEKEANFSTTTIHTLTISLPNGKDREVEYKTEIELATIPTTVSA